MKQIGRDRNKKGGKINLLPLNCGLDVVCVDLCLFF